MQRIAIIGGGAAGAAVFGELLRRTARGDCALHWVIGRRAPARGVAYSTEVPEHLLNVRAAGMSLYADEPGAFLDWLRANGRRVAGPDFVPRRCFGDFAEASVARRMLEASADGRRFELHSSEARALNLTGSGWRVVLDDGAALDVDVCILALGAVPPRPLPGVTPRALASGAYLTDPWQSDALEADPSEVVVIGTGLTAVDALLAAARRWPQARLTAVSRHGALPFAHDELPPAPYEHQAELIERLRERPHLRTWFELLREAATLDDGTDWRAVIDGLRPASSVLWRALDPAERRRFLRHGRWLWDLLRHRMPPAVAASLAALRAKGRLRVEAGRILSVDGDGPLDLALRWRGALATTQRTADLVIQATGLETDLTTTRHPLIRGLLDSGVVAADPLRLGFTATPDGRLYDADGAAAPGLYAIGTLLRGAGWECTGMPEIRALARDLALRVARYELVTA